MSDYPPSVSIEQLGADYEKYVAGYFEQIHDCTVIPQGRLRGLRDGGIDLIAVNDETAYLVQCKYHSASTPLHSKYVSQLYGDACVFASRFPQARKVTPVLVAHCGFAPDAKEHAAALDVKLVRLPYQPVALPYLTGKNYLSSLPGDYDSAVRDVLLAHRSGLSGRHSAPEPVQRPALPDQTDLPAYHPAPVPSQTIPAADQTTPEPNRSTNPAASSTPPCKPDPPAKPRYWIDTSVYKPSIEIGYLESRTPKRSEVDESPTYKIRSIEKHTAPVKPPSCLFWLDLKIAFFWLCSRLPFFALGICIAPIVVFWELVYSATGFYVYDDASLLLILPFAVATIATFWLVALSLAKYDEAVEQRKLLIHCAEQHPQNRMCSSSEKKKMSAVTVCLLVLVALFLFIVIYSFVIELLRTPYS